MANRHNSEALARIARARENYETRASRRPKGRSRSDVTLYDIDGYRRPPADTLRMRQQIAGGAQIIREGNGYTTIFRPSPEQRLLKAIFEGGA